ncbi:MAG: hypothetical protein E7324_04790 [Clostridiales bacterium]|nr:hypothetical protein [Clostridiales bacterium]
MERDLPKEIDSLKAAIEEIRAMFTHALPEGNEKVGHVEKIAVMHPDPAINGLMARLQDSCGRKGTPGQITYLGVFASGGRQSNWIRNDTNVENLLRLAESGTVEKVLACLGNGDRMRLLVSLLRKPQTVAEIVENGYSSTGQVYHLLKPLMAADLVQESESRRGQYAVVPHRVQGIVMLLAGISDLVDPTHTKDEI